MSISLKTVIPPQFRILAWAIVLGLVVFLGWLFLQGRDSKQATQASAEQGVRTGQAASGIAEDLGAAADDTKETETAVDSARDEYQRGYEDAKRNDPTVQPWGSQPVPQRLRDLARQRRLSRERPGCDGPGCADDDGAERQ